MVAYAQLALQHPNLDGEHEVAHEGGGFRSQGQRPHERRRKVLVAFLAEPAEHLLRTERQVSGEGLGAPGDLRPENSLATANSGKEVGLLPAG